VCTFSSLKLFPDQLLSLSPGVVLAEHRMPFADGLEVQRRRRDRHNDLKLILCSKIPDTRVVVEAMRQGPITVLDIPHDSDKLLRSLTTTFSQLERIRTAGVRLPEPLPAGRLYLQTLSRREREVIDLVYQSKTNKSVAITLGISIKTVEKHRGKATRRMRVACLAELI